MDLYEEKSQSYYSNIRNELIGLIPHGAQSVFELGAGCGDTLLEIKRRNPSIFVVGLELNQIDKSNQLSPLLDRFFFGDIESDDIDLSGYKFDVIVIGDVLEHLFDPWRVIEKLKRSLKPGGLFIVSIPNARHYDLIRALVIQGSFDYQEHGILDKTHLRFFCKKDMMKLFSEAGIEIDSIKPIFVYATKSKLKWFNTLTFGLFEEFISLQYVIVGH